MVKQTINLLLDIDFGQNAIKRCEIIENNQTYIPYQIPKEICTTCNCCSNDLKIFLFTSDPESIIKVEDSLIESVIVKIETKDEYLDEKYEEAKEFECQFCGKSLKNLAGLTVYQKYCKKNEKSGVRKYGRNKELHDSSKQVELCDDKMIKVKKRKKVDRIQDSTPENNQIIDDSTTDSKEEKQHFECNFCPKTFQRINPCFSHEKYCKHNPMSTNFVGTKITNVEITCKTCQAQLNIDNYKSHRTKCITPRSDELNCKYCGKILNNYKAARRHERNIHENPELFCELCGYKTKRRKEFHYHRIGCMSNNPKPFKCDICAKNFQTLDHIRNHMRIFHIQLKPFLCELCSKTFSTKGLYNIHVNHVHCERNFECNKCKKRFKNNESLKKHDYAMHAPDDEKQIYRCEECNFTSYNANSMNNHKLNHLDDSEKQFRCSYCSKGLNTKANLLRHERTHFDVRPFICDVCKKGFKSKDDLRTHTRYHTGEKPYECEICKQRYSDRGCYRSHLIQHEKQLGIVLDKSVKKFITKQ